MRLLKTFIAVAGILFLARFLQARDGTVLVIDKLAPKNAAFIGVVDSSQTLVNTTNFSLNLSTNDTTVQKALDTIDQLTTGSGGTPGGSNTQFQYNNSGSFAGHAVLTAPSTSQVSFNSVSVASYTNFNSLTISGDIKVDYSAINSTTAGSYGFLLPGATNCLQMTQEGQICWDTLADVAYIAGSPPKALIMSQTSLQPNATYYVSSGTVQNQLSVGSIKFADGTIQISSGAGMGGSGFGGGGRPIETFSNFDGFRSSPTLSVGFGDALSFSVSGSTGLVTVDFSSVASLSNITLGQGRPLEVFSNFDGVKSTPTLSIAGGDGMLFSVSGSTAIFNIDYSSVASRSDSLALFLQLSSANITYISQSSGTANLLSKSSATVTYLTLSSATANLLVKGATTTLIMNRNDPQPNSQFNVSSGAIIGQLLVDSILFRRNGTVQVSSAPVATNFINNQNTLQANATFYVSSGTATGFSSVSMFSSTGIIRDLTVDTLRFKDGTIMISTGVNTFIQSDSNGVPKDFPASGTYGDGTFIVLSSGSWEIFGTMVARKESATWTNAECGISISSGNTGAGLRLGQSRALGQWAVSATTPEFFPYSIGPIQATLTADTSYFLKVSAGYTLNQPRYEFAITARRKL